MNGDQIYKRALRQTHTNENDYTTTQANEDMEFRNQELVDEIVSISKGDYFWDLGKTDTVIGQSEYVAEKLGIAPDDLDIKKINKVFIKYTSTQEFFTKVRYQIPGTLEQHPDYYKDQQPTTDPFFYIQDNSIFIYPAPSEVVVGGVELFVIHKPAAIDVTSTEDDIEIPTQFHKLISSGMRIDIYTSQNKLNEAQLAQTEYNNEIKKMVAIMKERYAQPIKRTYSNNVLNNNR